MDGLRDLYDNVYVSGKENFFSLPLDRIYSEVYKFSKRHVYGKNVIDLGCGDGSFVVNYLIHAYPATIVGIDFSEKGISIAKKKLRDEIKKIKELREVAVRFIVRDFLNDREDREKYDVAISIGVIEHLDRPADLFRVVRDKLKPDGLFILEHPNFTNIRGIIWKTLEIFFDVQMSLTDKHTVLPVDIIDLCDEYGFEVEEVKTFNISLGMGDDLFEDFYDRLRKALKDKVNNIDNRIHKFFEFLNCVIKKEVIYPAYLNGADIVWRLRKRW